MTGSRLRHQPIPPLLVAGSRSLSYLLGGAILVLAAAVMVSGLDLSAVAAWALGIFSATFLALYSALVGAAVFSWTRLTEGGEPAKRSLWREVGLHAANGVSTVALTYTLLGIGLGIGSLSGRPLDPTTIQAIVADLTRHFSLAFMTTVVGLPTAAALRALLLITDVRRDGLAGDMR